MEYVKEDGKAEETHTKAVNSKMTKDIGKKWKEMTREQKFEYADEDQ